MSLPFNDIYDYIYYYVYVKSNNVRLTKILHYECIFKGIQDLSPLCQISKDPVLCTEEEDKCTVHDKLATTCIRDFLLRLNKGSMHISNLYFSIM